MLTNHDFKEHIVVEVLTWLSSPLKTNPISVAWLRFTRFLIWLGTVWNITISKETVSRIHLYPSRRPVQHSEWCQVACKVHWLTHKVSTVTEIISWWNWRKSSQITRATYAQVQFCSITSTSTIQKTWRHPRRRQGMKSNSSLKRRSSKSRRSRRIQLDRLKT